MSRHKTPPAPPTAAQDRHYPKTVRTPAQKEAYDRLMRARRDRVQVWDELIRRFFVVAAQQAEERAALARIAGGPVCPHCGMAHNVPVKSLEGTPGSGVLGGGMIDLVGWGSAGSGS